MSGANTSGSKLPGHRASGWVTPTMYPFVAAVGAIALFGMYSVSRHVMSDPDIGKHSDLGQISEAAADKYRESPLRKAVARETETK